MNKKWLIIFRWIKVATLGVMAIFFLFLVGQKISFGHSLIYETNFSAADRFIQGPYPEGRVASVVLDSLPLKRLLIEPVYFSVYSPRKFRTARVTIIYRKNQTTDFKIGVALRGGDWLFDLKKMPDFADNNFHEATVDFNLEKAARPQNKLKFIMASANLAADASGIDIQQIRFELTK
jgi:hypothetical protein